MQKIIKSESLDSFIDQYVLGYIRETNHSHYDKEFFKDEVFVNKSDFFVSVKSMVFERQDFSMKSDKELINKYEYSVEDYDDISLKLKLVNSEVIPKQYENN